MNTLNLDLESNELRLANYRKVAKHLGLTQEEFTDWITRLFERYAALDGREASATAREQALDQREKAVARREKAVAAQLSEMRSRLGALAEEPAA
jgi:DNA repair ATPase RecN